MAFDETLAQRLRAALRDQPDCREQKMMGALVFMVSGHMCCGVTGDGMMVRLGPDGARDALTDPDVGPLNIGGGRAPRGFVVIARQGVALDDALQAWLNRALAFVATLPPKPSKG